MNVSDLGEYRPSAAPRYERIHGSWRALSMSLNFARGQVSHPANYAKFLSFLLRGSAIAHALHAAFDLQ